MDDDALAYPVPDPDAYPGVEFGDQEQQRLAKLRLLREAGLDPYPPRFARTHSPAEALAAFADWEAGRGTEPTPTESNAGRGVEPAPTTPGRGTEPAPTAPGRGTEPAPTAPGSDEPLRLSTAGRVVGRRIMGKASFAHIASGGGRLQLFFRADDLTAPPYDYEAF